VNRDITIESTAWEDVRRISNSIRRRVSIQSSERWLSCVDAAVQSLRVNADGWPLADDPGLEGHEVRVRLFGRRPHIYRILFRVDPTRVVIHRIRHAAQDYLGEDEL